MTPHRRDQGEEAVERVLLLVLDGMGIAPPGPGNAVTARSMSGLFALMERFGHARLEASGEPVGLQPGITGNSEVGHLTIGAGRRIPSRLSEIDAACRDGRWRGHAAWEALADRGIVHVVGLLSDAGVHGHARTMLQAAGIAAGLGIRDVVVHPILDGVDSPAGSAPAALARLRGALKEIAGTRLGVVMGRRWFCDRSGDRGVSEVFAAALTGEVPLARFTDEALEAHLRSSLEADFPAHLAEGGRPVGGGEPVVLTSHRADRATQAARALLGRAPVHSMVELGDAVPRERVFFPTTPLTRGLGFELAGAGIASLRVAEQCKFPHVTFFLNGFHDSLGERSICIPSIAEARIAAQPDMSLAGVLDVVRTALADPGERAVIANFANLDQVGHLGNLPAAEAAAGHVDRAVSSVLEDAVRFGWTVVVTADHGNADRVLTEAGDPYGSHTANPVPLIVVPPAGRRVVWSAREGTLANVAATVLAALGTRPPDWMEPPLALVR